MLEDVARIHLMGSDDAEVTLITTTLLENHAGEEPALAALKIKKGHLVLRDGVALPVVRGRTAVADYLDHDGLKSPEILQTPLHETGTIAGGLFVAGHQNYYHFLVYFLPGFLFLKALPRTSQGPLALYMSAGVPRPLQGFVELLLPALGGAPVSLTRLSEGVYGVADVIFPTLPKLFAPALICRRIVLPFVMHRAGIKDPLREQGALKLFVRRDNAPGGRHLTNQKEIEAWFVARGYTSIDPGLLTFEDQVILFARATHIAGVEGAAMANILFAQHAQEILLIASPAARKYELFAPLLTQYNVVFKTLYGELPPGSPKKRSADFHLPLTLLEETR